MRYYAAPMEGLTGWIYRQVHRRCFPGVDRYYMPFVATNQFHAFNRKERQELDPANNDLTDTVPQLLGRNAEDFLWGAEEMAARGYREVSLNLGCPSGTVVAKGKGSGFLAHPEELERFLDAVFSAAPLPISLKTRLGMESEEEFPRLLELFRRYPVAELTVHARVRTDYYRGNARVDAFRQAVEGSPFPVCYNGDLYRPADFHRVTELCPEVSALMTGRGLMADPALIRRAKGGSPASREELKAFHDTLYAGYCTAFGSDYNASLRMKELWFYMIGLFDGGERPFKRLKKSSNAGEYRREAAHILEELPLREVSLLSFQA